MASRSWKKGVKRGPGGSGWVLEQPWALAVTKDGLQVQKLDFLRAEEFSTTDSKQSYKKSKYKFINIH